MSLLGSLLAKKEAAPKLTAICDVRRHVSQPVYFLQSYCREKQTGIHTNWGYLVSLTEAEMKLQGLGLVLADLREYPHRDSDHRLPTSNKTPEGKRQDKAWRESVPVLVSHLPDGTLEFTPAARWSRSAWTHLTDRTLTLQQPTTPEAFFEMLTAAFDRCIPETR